MATETLPADIGLSRELGLVGATWASWTSMAGAGLLFGAFYAAQAVGGAAVLAWVIGGVMVLLLALCHAELGAMYPVSGGTARFPHFAFGSAAGISFGFFSYLQAAAVAPVECYALIQSAAYYWPGLYDTGTGNVSRAGFVLTIVLMAIFVAVNFLAMRVLARISNIITWWKVAIPVLTIIVLLAYGFHGGNFTAAHRGFMPGGFKALFGALPGAGIVFAYLGFEQADQLAGEIKNPARNLPLAIVFSVLIATVIYTLLQVVFIAAMPASLLSHGFPGITNSGILSVPFAGLAGVIGIGWLASILRIDRIVAASGTGLIYPTGASRVAYGLARNRYVPQIFGLVDRRGVPWVGLMFTYIAGLVFLLPFPSWHSVVGVITGASVLMYAGAPLSLGAFRRQVPEALRPYRMPAAAVQGPLAFIVAGLLIYWSGFETVWKLGLVLVLGYLVIGVGMAFDPQRPPLDWRSATWLPAWLLGMGIISWQGQFSGANEAHPLPPANTMQIGFGYDILTVAAFSLIIYYWAMLARLPRSEMLRLVGDQAGDL
jgi:amino acid transporter